MKAEFVDLVMIGSVGKGRDDLWKPIAVEEGWSGDAGLVDSCWTWMI